MTTNARIYKLTALTQNENTSGIEKVDFGDAALLTGIQFVASRKYTDNGSPGIDLARKPDTGFKVGKIIIDCAFILEQSTQPPQIAQLRKWVTGPNITSVFPEGQFGFRFDKIPAYNTKPTGTSGLKVLECVVQWTAAKQTYANGQIILEYSGDGANFGG